jgi:hypothetical protein
VPTYLYGLVLSRNAGRVPANVTGLDRAPVRVVVCDDLAALVSTVDQSPSRHDLASIAIHDRATSQVVRHATTVAASRFGQTFADDTALCAELSSSSQRVRTTLERYDGYGEMRITMREAMESPTPVRAPTASPESPGRAYLQSLREKLNPRAPVDLRPILGDLVLDERVERRKDLQTIAHLVRFDDEARYRMVLRAHPALEGASIAGPHALYAFAEAGQ